MKNLKKEDPSFDSNSKRFENGKFVIVGQGYYWPLKGGCVCPTGAKYGSLPGTLCSDEQKNEENNCRDIPYPKTEYIDMPIVNGKKFCAFRDTSYTLMDIS